MWKYRQYRYLNASIVSGLQSIYCIGSSEYRQHRLLKVSTVSVSRSTYNRKYRHLRVSIVSILVSKNGFQKDTNNIYRISLESWNCIKFYRIDFNTRLTDDFELRISHCIWLGLYSIFSPTTPKGCKVLPHFTPLVWRHNSNRSVTFLSLWIILTAIFVRFFRLQYDNLSPHETFENTLYRILWLVFRTRRTVNTRRGLFYCPPSKIIRAFESYVRVHII